jgi:hypothetical protein
MRTVEKGCTLKLTVFMPCHRGHYVFLKQIIWNLYTRSGTIKGRLGSISQFDSIFPFRWYDRKQTSSCRMKTFLHFYCFIYFYFLMLLFMNHCNDFAPCGPSIGQYKFLFLYLYYCVLYTCMFFFIIIVVDN